MCGSNELSSDIDFKKEFLELKSEISHLRKESLKRKVSRTEVYSACIGTASLLLGGVGFVEEYQPAPGQDCSLVEPEQKGSGVLLTELLSGEGLDIQNRFSIKNSIPFPFPLDNWSQNVDKSDLIELLSDLESLAKESSVIETLDIKLIDELRVDKEGSENSSGEELGNDFPTLLLIFERINFAAIDGLSKRRNSYAVPPKKPTS